MDSNINIITTPIVNPQSNKTCWCCNKIHKDFELIECKICAEEHASLFECSFCKYLICRTCRPQLPSIYIY